MKSLLPRIAAVAILLVATQASADFFLPAVPMGATLRAQFVLSASSGAPLSGVPITITPVNGCGLVAGGTSTVVTTNGSGTATFDFTPGSVVGNCRIEGRNGSTVGYAVTFVYNPATLRVAERSTQASRVKTLKPSTRSSLAIVATALNENAAHVEVTGQPVTVQVLPDENGASATVSAIGNLVTGNLTQLDGSVGMTLDTNATEGIYDLRVSVAGTTRLFRIQQQAVDGASATRTPTGLPLMLEPLTVSVSGAPATCMLTSATYQPPGALPTNLPAGAAGFFGSLIDVTWTGCPQTFALRFDFAQDVPAGSSFQAAFLTPSRTASWVRPTTVITGKSVTISVSPSSFVGHLLGGVTTAGTPPAAPPRLAVKDLWWSGLEENGWGMSIVQSDDRSKLFPVIFAYDDQGRPSWWVGDGWWDIAKSVFHVNFYQPRGTPWYAFDAGIEVVGEDRGKAAITFADADHATFDYRIDARTGRKSLQRQPFGPASTASVPDVGGMWWGGQDQSGWGISIAQQSATLFSVWYSYDERNFPTWVVMPGGTWTSSSTYEGRVYRTHSSAWLGQAYDKSKLVVTDVGSYRFRFDGASATFDYTIDGRSASLALSRQSPF